MKRYQFLLTLFGFGATAKAQNVLLSTDSFFSPDSSGAFLWKGTPINNQCPVCGTMADPFLKSEWAEAMTRYYEDYSFMNLPLCAPSPSDAPKDRNVKCLKCRCVFWQESE